MEIKEGTLGIIEASLKYFDGSSEELSDFVKQHINKKSQEQRQELIDKRAHLEKCLEKQRLLEEEKIRIEADCAKANLHKNRLRYFNTEYKNELFGLQKQIFEVETDINKLSELTPKYRPNLNYEEDVNSESQQAIPNVQKNNKTYKNRLEIAEYELEQATVRIRELENECKVLNKEIDSLNARLSVTMFEKKQLLLQNKKIFDEKFKHVFTNRSEKLVRKHALYK